jgi:hypothetical protein
MDLDWLPVVLIEAPLVALIIWRLWHEHEGMPPSARAELANRRRQVRRVLGVLVIFRRQR